MGSTPTAALDVKDRSENMMQALIAKLYNTVTGNDGNIHMPRDKFVSWLLPGIPFAEDDFWYCSKRLVDSSAEDTRKRYHQAFVLSKLFDFVPGVHNQFVERTTQQTIFTSTQDSISSVYRDVLNYSGVLDMPLSQAEKAKLEKFRNALSVTKEVESLAKRRQ